MRCAPTLENNRRVLWVIWAVVGMVLGWAIFMPRVELDRESDPTGRYTAIFTYRPYLVFGHDDNDGAHVRIVDLEGRDYGEIYTSCYAAEGVEWTRDGARVQQAGEWNFREGWAYEWSADGERRVFVKGRPRRESTEEGL